MISVVIVWTVAFFFSNLFQCWPLWVNWTDWGSTPNNCINTNVMYLAQAWSDVLTDGKTFPHSSIIGFNLGTVIILTLPLPCVGLSASVTLISANVLIDLGNATARKAQDCRERHVPSWWAVSCAASGWPKLILISSQDCGGWNRKARCLQHYCSRCVSRLSLSLQQALIFDI